MRRLFSSNGSSYGDTDSKLSYNENGEEKFPIDLENWMGNLPYCLVRLPIIYLSIPGSHNSFSYSLTPTSEISPDSPDIVKSLGRWFRPIANRIVYNWSMGQQEDVITQLSYGIRYFDIRLVNRDGDIFISHGLYGGYIEIFLREIRKFLNSHPKEAVILDFQHFYNFKIQQHQFITNAILMIFGEKLCPRKIMMREVTLEELWVNKYQVLIIYRHAYVNYIDKLWPSASWITAWPNKIKTSELLEYLDMGIATRKDGVGFVSQGILTPTVKYIILHIGGTLKKLALRNNRKLSQWLDSKTNGLQGVNVVICDFVETYNFCDKVIRLNYIGVKDDGRIKSFDQECGGGYD